MSVLLLFQLSHLTCGTVHWPVRKHRVQCLYNTVNFYQNSHKRQPHSSSIRVRYGLSFVGSYSDLYSASVTAAMYAISCYIVPHYNGTWLQVLCQISPILGKQTVINIEPCDSVPTANFAWTEGFRMAELLISFGLCDKYFYYLVNCFACICLSSQIPKQEVYVSKAGQYGVFLGWFVPCDTSVIAKLKIQLTKMNLNTQSIVQYWEITLAILNYVISCPNNAGIVLTGHFGIKFQWNFN